MPELITWTDALETGLPTVDAQHQELVRLANRVGDMMIKADGIDLAVIDNAFVDLVNYTKYHFAEEEGFMDKSGLPPGVVKEHKLEHRDFVNKVAMLWISRNGNPKRTFADLSAFLQAWIYRHILVVDKEMASLIGRMESV